MRSVLLVLSALTLSAADQTPARPAEGDPGLAIEQLRAALRARDFEGGLRESDSLVQQFPSSPELGALHVALMEQAGVGLTEETEDLGLTAEAQDAADSLARRFPTSPWSAYAQGIANVRRDYRLKQVLTLAERALAAQPHTEELIALKAQALCRMGMSKEAEAFLNAQTAKGPKSATLLALKANVIVAEAKGSLARRDTTAIARGLAAFAQARTVDSTYVGGFSLDGPCAASPLSGRRAGEGYALSKRAIELAPFAAAVHDAYWSAVLGRSDHTAEEQRAEVESDIDQLLSARPNYPGVLALAAHGYDRLKLTDKRKAVTARLLASFPASVYAEQTWWGDWEQSLVTTFTNGGDSGLMQIMTQMAATKRQVGEYIARPAHGSRAVRAAVDIYLFQNDFMSDSAARFVEAAVHADPNTIAEQGSFLAISLADRRVMNAKLDLGFARRLAYRADTLCRLSAVSMRETYTTPSDYVDELNGCTAGTHDAIGWIDFREGAVAAADRELQAACDAQPHNGLVRMHRGELLESEGKVADAEMLYLMDGDQVSLRRMYLKAHAGSLDGFDAYWTQRKADVRAIRLAEIRATRIAKPQPLPRFSLDRFGSSGRFTIDSLKGKFVIVNFWGVWCGPCVMETPQIQTLSEALESDTSVVFLTIDTRDSREELTAFMAGHKFDYPVLFDNGWAAKVQQVGAYPTTLFIDRQGRVVFRQVGRSDQLVDDFTLRLELLKTEGSAPR
jgi:thiol-disulfide isomerase/thioredoxin/tetratricopeptide (TPR) repeat protein